ncbi:hypothetical protein [Kitasatospora camelliae]|uniref:DUF4375 domain-containing protein n=1 Tax=Kitasatospora camelliae TaxID=3156397 RepID=A0AAU8JRZ1_9ACTN
MATLRTTPQTAPDVTDERLCWLLVRDDLARKARRGGWWWRLLTLSQGDSRATNWPDTGEVGEPRRGMAATRMVDAFQGMHGEGRPLGDAAGEMRRELASGRMADYALAVDDTAETLTAEERRTLRAERTLPARFMPEVERRYQEIRKRG